MDYDSILTRIFETVEHRAYLTPVGSVPAEQQEAMARIGAEIQRPDFEPDAVRQLVEQRFAEGRIDAVRRLSALHVIAADPRVGEWTEAARLVGEQEQAALALGGPHLEQNLASVERHRGVLAFLQGHYGVALDYFSRAFERERSAENIGNILCTLVRIGELDEADELLARIRSAFPRRLVAELEERLARDPDLAVLQRNEVSQ